jgi:hypothetical protein
VNKNTNSPNNDFKSLGWIHTVIQKENTVIHQKVKVNNNAEDINTYRKGMQIKWMKKMAGDAIQSYA